MECQAGLGFISPVLHCCIFFKEILGCQLEELERYICIETVQPSANMPDRHAAKDFKKEKSMQGQQSIPVPLLEWPGMRPSVVVSNL
jgi:hypothetical protein